MFVIREAHLQAQSARMKDEFTERMVRHLREDFPQYLRAQGLSGEHLDDLVRRGIADAERHGVVYQGDIERYIEFMAMLGPAFPQDPKYPWAGETLRRRDLDGEAKMDLISEHVTFEVEALPDE